MLPLFLEPSISQDLCEALAEVLFGDLAESLAQSYSTTFVNFYFKTFPQTLYEMFFEALPEALSSTRWSSVITACLAVIIVIPTIILILAAIVLFRAGIFSPKPTVHLSRVSCRRSNMDGWKRVSTTTRRIEPAPQPSSSSTPPPARAKKKAKKSVKFDLDRNETVEVEDWYVRTWGTGTSYAGVRWGEQLVWTVESYLEPHGHTQLHFPQTKWIRDVPSWDVENDDGDIEMTDV